MCSNYKEQCIIKYYNRLIKYSDFWYKQNNVKNYSFSLNLAMFCAVLLRFIDISQYLLFYY